MILYKTCPASSSPRGSSKTSCAVWNRANCYTIATQGHGFHITIATAITLYTAHKKSQGPRDSSSLSENATCSCSVGKSGCQESVQFHAETSHQAGFGPTVYDFDIVHDSWVFNLLLELGFDHSSGDRAVVGILTALADSPGFSHRLQCWGQDGV